MVFILLLSVGSDFIFDIYAILTESILRVIFLLTSAEYYVESARII